LLRSIVESQQPDKNMIPYRKAEERAENAKRGGVGIGGHVRELTGVEQGARELDCKFASVHIDHILICQPPMSALMIPNVIDPINIKMISAGMVATAHLTMRTTIDPNGILMSATTTFP
jgi:hypothetical protein